MFSARYWNARYWNARYWSATGAAPPAPVDEGMGAMIHILSVTIPVDELLAQLAIAGGARSFERQMQVLDEEEALVILS